MRLVNQRRKLLTTSSRRTWTLSRTDQPSRPASISGHTSRDLRISKANPIKKTFQFGEHTVTLETGEIARQADAAIMVNMADTVVLVTVVYDKNLDSGRDFFPLTVDYQERPMPPGKIPGGSSVAKVALGKRKSSPHA